MTTFQIYADLYSINYKFMNEFYEFAWNTLLDWSLASTAGEIQFEIF